MRIARVKDSGGSVVSCLSRLMALEPGDVIATGTPYGIGLARDPHVFLLGWDTVECAVEGIATLSNPIAVL